MKTREEQIEQNFQNIKNGSLIFAWEFDPRDTPFIVVAKKENDKIYSKIKETNSGVIVLDGYRKQSDTVRGFVEKLNNVLTEFLHQDREDSCQYYLMNYDVLQDRISALAAEYGAEVEE